MDDLESLEGCTYYVQSRAEGFLGEVELAAVASSKPKECRTILVSNFQLEVNHANRRPRSHDPQSHEQLWAFTGQDPSYLNAPGRPQAMSYRMGWLAVRTPEEASEAM